MADEMLLSSARVLPGRLTRAAFPFLYPDLESALAFELGRSPGPPGMEILHG
jgi:NAD dependent epimerase/dehydratase family enzyme